MRAVMSALMAGVGTVGIAAAAQAQQAGLHAALPDPSVALASSVTTAAHNSLGLWKCITASTITCYGVYTRKERGARDYSWPPEYVGKIRLFDNFKIEHAAAHGYYVNGRGLPQAKAHLDADDPIWFAVEFAGGADDITKARVAFPDDRGFGTLELTAPVEKAAP